MNQSAVDWIGQYLDWLQPAGWTVGAHPHSPGGLAHASADVGREFVTTYLDWMDCANPMRAAPSPYRAAAPDSLGNGADPAGLDAFEDVLLAALRTQSDSLQMLRAILDAGKSPPPIVKFASRTLARAEQLLEDQRRAWRYVTAVRQYRCSPPRADRDQTAWPHVLEEVAAQVHALQDTVLAMQRHRRDIDTVDTRAAKPGDG